MSIIIHRCLSCDHRDIDRSREGICTQDRCRCGVPSDGFGPPQVVPTFDTVTGGVIGEIVRPGTRWPLSEAGRPMAGAVPLCSCEGCVALFKEGA